MRILDIQRKYNLNYAQAAKLQTDLAALVEALQYAEKEISLLYYFALNHGVPEAENPPMDIIKDALEAVKS